MMHVGEVIAVAGFAAAAVLFFYLRIPAVIGELTGRTARREMRRIRKESADRD